MINLAIQSSRFQGSSGFQVPAANPATQRCSWKNPLYKMTYVQIGGPEKKLSKIEVDKIW